jgi:hypothetical protein
MKFILFSAIAVLSLGFFAGDALAAVIYEPIVEIPRLENTQSTEQYVNALYLLAITIAALLAVVKIIFGGVKWMLSDVVTDKSAAKKDIRGALLGLLIVLSAVIILNTINTDLTNLNILGDAASIGDTGGGGDGDDDEHVYPPVEIGDFHGMWCGNIFTFVCDEASQESLENFFKSCEEDAGGVIQTTPLDGYTCVEDSQQAVNELQDSGTIIIADASLDARQVFADAKAAAIADGKEVVFESPGPYNADQFRQLRIIECANLGATSYEIVARTTQPGGSEMMLCYK